MKFLVILFAFFSLLTGCVSTEEREESKRADLQKLNDIVTNKFTLYAEAGKIFLNTSSDSQLISQAKQTIKSMLKDPDSAQFRNVRIVSNYGGNLVCGDVNAKNSHGGYVGFDAFIAGPYNALLKPDPPPDSDLPYNKERWQLTWLYITRMGSSCQ